MGLAREDRLWITVLGARPRIRVDSSLACCVGGAWWMVRHRPGIDARDEVSSMPLSEYEQWQLAELERALTTVDPG
jgi:hypothetical protein